MLYHGSYILFWFYVLKTCKECVKLFVQRHKFTVTYKNVFAYKSEQMKKEKSNVCTCVQEEMSKRTMYTSLVDFLLK